MVNESFLIDGRALEFASAYPAGYRGTIIHGSEPAFATGSWGQLLLQDIRRSHWRLRHQCLQIVPGIKIRAWSADKGLTTIAMLANSCRQMIVGAGKTYLKEHQFGSMFSDAWTRDVQAGRGAPVVSLDTTWDENYLKKCLTAMPEFNHLVKKSTNGIPMLVGKPYREFTPRLSAIINELISFQYDRTALSVAEESLMDAYLLEILLQSVDSKSYLRKINPAELRKVVAAREFLQANTDEHYTIPDIAEMVGLNACALKRGFKQVEGKGLLEYLLWMRCNSVIDDMLRTNLPLKAFYKKAGYADLDSFVRGFEKHIGCSPTELRKRYLQQGDDADAQ